MQSFADFALAVIAYCKRIKTMDGLPLVLFFSETDQLYYVAAPGDHDRRTYTAGHWKPSPMISLDDEQAAIFFQAFANANSIALTLTPPDPKAITLQFLETHSLRITQPSDFIDADLNVPISELNRRIIDALAP